MAFLNKLRSFFTEQKSFALTPEFERFWISRGDRSVFTSTNLLGAYAAHELVYACINKIADVMNDAELVVEKKNSKGEWQAVEGHPLVSLVKKPNPYDTGRDFRRLMVQSEQAMGIFYGELVRSRAGAIVEMYPLNPNRVVPKLNSDGSGIAYYEFNRADGKTFNIAPENMLVRRRVDLANRFYGLSPLEVALKSVNSDLGMSDYVDAFFESDGTPSGILKILNATINETKAESLSKAWRNKYSRGGSNQKGVAVLDQNASFEKIGSNLNELASDELSGRFESRICAVFGVPPNLVGAYVGLLHVTANATAKAELNNFWDNKINPELSALREWLTWYVLPEFEDIDAIKAEKLRVGFDVSHVAFLQEDTEKIHLRARENFKAGGWTLNEFREATGLKPDPKGDYYLQPASLGAISPENRAEQAVQKVDAGKEDPVDQQQDPQDTEDTPKQLKSEKKTFELDGMVLAREPRGVETVISLKTIADGYESEKAKTQKILLKFRDSLIQQAADKIDKLSVENVYTLTLTPDPRIAKQLKQAFRDAYKRGREQVRQELIDQANAKNGSVFAFETKDEEDDEEDDIVDELTANAISKLINEIQSRAVNIYVLLKTLLDYTVDKLKERLASESSKFVEQTAGNMVNAAIRNGRDAEIKDNLDAVEIVEYSAILDANTCGPCAEADGMTALDPDELPQAPNPECEGGWNCRCFHVAILSESQN